MNNKIKKVYDSPLIPKEHADIYKDDISKYIEQNEKIIKENKDQIRNNLHSSFFFKNLAIS